LLKIRDAVTRLLEGHPSKFLRAQNRRTPPARSSHLSLRVPPGKKRPPRPGQGQRSARHRRWHRHVARGPPHLVAGPPRCPPRPGRRKNGPGRPLGVPTKSHSLIRKRPPSDHAKSVRANQVRPCTGGRWGATAPALEVRRRNEQVRWNRL
jgi:hypothetical protein